MHYFDHAATHPLSEVARAAWLDAATRFPANPSSLHRLGARADRALEGARARLAAMLGCSPGEVIFTSGATESNNLMVHHLAHALTGTVLVSSLEHPSVLEPTRHELAERRQLIPATPAGVVDLPWLENRLRTRPPAAVLLMAANNETGVLQPWREVAARCREHGVWFGCDAAQWLGKLPAAGLGACAFLTGCAHKFGGPPGVGFLKGPTTLRPLLRGGPQEDRRRAGTQNLPGILAMVASLEARERELAVGGAEQRIVWRDRFVARVQQALPGTELLGADAPRLWNTVSLQLPPRADGRRWVVALDRLGFAVASGSACSSGRDVPSHVLEAMGRSRDNADRVVRFSSGWETPESAWEVLIRKGVSS
ncbi:MAG: cysteine desulfurase [Verrucomicrobiales bacterium]|nr:cysteine desulfurase [Verrucomicrobiales bacterium]